MLKGNSKPHVFLRPELYTSAPSPKIVSSDLHPGPEPSVEERMALKVGEMAPDFEVPGVLGEEKVTVKLSDYRGKKNVVIAFYPLDWTPV